MRRERSDRAACSSWCLLSVVSNHGCAAVRPCVGKRCAGRTRRRGARCGTSGGNGAERCGKVRKGAASDARRSRTRVASQCDRMNDAAQCASVGSPARRTVSAKACISMFRRMMLASGRACIGAACGRGGVPSRRSVPKCRREMRGGSGAARACLPAGFSCE